ncbi:hypothetical protein XBO1_2630046 [Xenorhabdus bovienii str. oregonense]|uniref:Uncharacterized protein n=1 Tax=Xenorhabdus bovienii str. oregonense TaxID=1398202 RepID=A0A077P9F3_XENBV|nr:hypothetical protein XBO1_2630046 [Xenorhabdus bovienii str. oregonense]
MNDLTIQYMTDFYSYDMCIQKSNLQNFMFNIGYIIFISTNILAYVYSTI